MEKNCTNSCNAKKEASNTVSKLQDYVPCRPFTNSYPHHMLLILQPTGDEKRQPSQPQGISLIHRKIFRINS